MSWLSNLFQRQPHKETAKPDRKAIYAELKTEIKRAQDQSRSQFHITHRSGEDPYLAAALFMMPGTDSGSKFWKAQSKARDEATQRVAHRHKLTVSQLREIEEEGEKSDW